MQVDLELMVNRKALRQPTVLCLWPIWAAGISSVWIMTL